MGGGASVYKGVLGKGKFEGDSLKLPSLSFADMALPDAQGLGDDGRVFLRPGFDIEFGVAAVADEALGPCSTTPAEMTCP